MTKEQIIRAWKDEEYRAGLDPEEFALLPEHPAGVVELSEHELQQVPGAAAESFSTLACFCPGDIISWLLGCTISTSNPTLDYGCRME